MSEYLEFVELENDGRITKRFDVRSKRRDFSLGEIAWHGAWRQYAFFPWMQTLFNRDCLRDIAEFLDKLMEERKR
jgi:hypothetical protein